MIVLVTGGRNNHNRAAAKRALKSYNGPGNILISGGADGWDCVCEQIWHTDFQLPYVVVPAPWKLLGKFAGLARNGQMVDGEALTPYAALVPDVVIAGSGGVGTADCISRAQAAGIEVIVASD